MTRKRIVIVGAGTAGITVAARLRRADSDLDISLVAPDEKHYYQPLWTLVGGGLATFAETERDNRDLMPKGVRWVRDRVATFAPDDNALYTEGGQHLEYDGLVVAPGISVRLDEVQGLQQALDEDPRVWTNYLPQYVGKGPEAIARFAAGNALFTKPRSPLKCGGAPQKIMWIAEHSLRKQGVRDAAEVCLVVPEEAIFGVPRYAAPLQQLADERGVKLVPGRHLVEVRPDDGVAVFEMVGSGEEVEMPYGLLHVTPPQRAPDFIAKSPLAAPGFEVPEDQRTPAARKRGLPQRGDGGFVEVDRHTGQHVRYPNVFALGDAASFDTAKTGAGVRKQAPVVVQHLLAHLRNGKATKTYDGYTSCPLVVGHDRVILAEFGYDGAILESFPFNQAKPRWSMWLLKRWLLPQLYWHGMLKGRA